MRFASTPDCSLVEKMDGTVIDEDEILQEKKSCVLMILKPGEAWTSASSSASIPVSVTTLSFPEVIPVSSMTSSIDVKDGNALSIESPVMITPVPASAEISAIATPSSVSKEGIQI